MLIELGEVDVNHEMLIFKYFCIPRRCDAGWDVTGPCPQDQGGGGQRAGLPTSDDPASRDTRRLVITVPIGQGSQILVSYWSDCDQYMFISAKISRQGIDFSLLIFLTGKKGLWKVLESHAKHRLWPILRYCLKIPLVPWGCTHWE